MRRVMRGIVDPTWTFILRLAIVIVLAGLAFFYGPFVFLMKLWLTLALAALAGVSLYFARDNHRNDRGWIDNILLAAVTVGVVALLWR